jgi:hypothetical protein
MKRRHIQPNTRTFTTLFVGLSRIDDWTTYSNILQRVFATFDQLLVHFEQLKLKNPESKDITPWPINGFLTLLGKAHHYSKMWDVFFNMEGQLAPDEYTYTVMLKALQSRTSLDQQPVRSDFEAEETEIMEMIEKERWEDQFRIDGVPEEQWGVDVVHPRERDQKVQESVYYKNAADARILWESMIKANKKDPEAVPLTSFLIAPTLHLLARGRPTDQTLAFQIISQYVHIKSPKGDALKKSPIAVKLNGPLFFAILEVCIRSARSELAMEYFQQIAEDREMKKVIDSGHMMYIMRAFAMRRQPKGQACDAREAVSALQWMLREPRSRELSDGVGKLAPTIHHFVYALTAAWRGADMSSALTVLELMTGLERTQFMIPVPAIRENSAGWAFHPKFGCSWNVTCMALLVKTAEATQKRENMRIAMRVINTATPGRFFARAFGGVPMTDETISAQRELAMRMIRVLDTLQKAGYEVEGNVWQKLKSIAEAESRRLNKIIVKNIQDESKEDELRKAGMVKDGDVQQLVTLKGRRSAWATNL